MSRRQTRVGQLWGNKINRDEPRMRQTAVPHERLIEPRTPDWPRQTEIPGSTGGVAELWDLTRRTEVAAFFGAWLIGKDWRDLFPSKRDTASWSLLPHD